MFCYENQICECEVAFVSNFIAPFMRWNWFDSTLFFFCEFFWCSFSWFYCIPSFAYFIQVFQLNLPEYFIIHIFCALFACDNRLSTSSKMKNESNKLWPTKFCSSFYECCRFFAFLDFSSSKNAWHLREWRIDTYRYVL